MREGDHYIVNGQKTWTTLAQHADWGFFLVRTDPAARKQAGISFLLIDMKRPGVTVRPIITLDGAHEVNEVWLENVRVPVENRVYEENKGWTCAKMLLAHERSGIALRRALQGRAGQSCGKLAAAVGQRRSAGWPTTRCFRRKLTEVDVELSAPGVHRAAHARRGERRQGAGRRSVDAQGPGHRDSPAAQRADAGSGGHAARADVSRPRAAVGVDAVADAGRRRHRRHVLQHAQDYRIFGGSNEIQRNILAKAVLGF